MYNKDTKKGFLTSQLDEYLSCFFCDLEKIEGLLEKDLKLWTASVEKTQQRSNKIKDEFQALLALEDKKITELLDA